MDGESETRGRAVFSGKAHKSCVDMTHTHDDERNTLYHQGDNALLMGVCRMFTICRMPSHKSCDGEVFVENTR